jgi:D-glycero-alpha-D-manno-heptose-7-phosphate kinase
LVPHSGRVPRKVPMIICRTPFRVSFFGGGTDYKSWYTEHGGSVLATTIDKYCYLTCRYLPPFFEHRLRIVWSKIETCKEVDEITHHAARAVLTHMKVDRGLEIHHDGDLPARSGIGSSSAFTVGLLHCLHALRGQLVSTRDLAAEAVHVEQNILCEAVGSQDQVMAAYGGFRQVVFEPGSAGEIIVKPLPITPERLRLLNDHLLLLYTGIVRTASEVAASYEMRGRNLRVIRDLVDDGLAVLSGGDIADFGELLHEGWMVKRGLGEMVSNGAVDEMYAAALSEGATGGKLLGAGGGGFLLLFAPPDRHGAIVARLGLLNVPFKFDWRGSEIIFVERQEEYGSGLHG